MRNGPSPKSSKRSNGGFNAPAIARIEGVERRLVIYDRTGQVAWDYPFGAFVEALHQAESSLADYGS